MYVTIYLMYVRTCYGKYIHAYIRTYILINLGKIDCVCFTYFVSSVLSNVCGCAMGWLSGCLVC